MQLKRWSLIAVMGWVFISATLLSSAFTSHKTDERDEIPYPQGKRFPLGLYSLDVHTMVELAEVKESGWNMGHTYAEQEPFLERVRHIGWLKPPRMFAFAHISDKEEAAAKSTIEKLAAYDCVGWWYLPEEQRYWREEEFNLIKNLTQWTRKYDPKRRPNFMYIPGHYTADDIAHYVPYLDIIGAGTYTEYMHMPRAWVRYRIESEIEAIRKAGFKVGSDYLHGEKTPIGILMCFQNNLDLNEHDVISPVEAYHDFYSCLASGARGILVFSYFHRNDLDVLRKTYEAYAKAASEVSGPEGLGQALLFGEEVPLTFTITEGPQRTYSFRPYGLKQDISYPSLNLRAVKWNGSLYIVAVNSADEGIKATIKNLPETAKEAKVLFETETLSKRSPKQRIVRVSNQQMEDSFGWLGVRVYQIKM